MEESSGENKEEECCSDEEENNKRMKGDDSNDGEGDHTLEKGMRGYGIENLIPSTNRRNEE